MQAKKIKKKMTACKLLKEWLESHNSNMHQFANMLKCNYMNVWNWGNGLTQPSLKSAVLIERKTNGYVPCRAWVTLDKSSEPKNAKKKTTDRSHKR